VRSQDARHRSGCGGPCEKVNVGGGGGGTAVEGGVKSNVRKKWEKGEKLIGSNRMVSWIGKKPSIWVVQGESSAVVPWKRSIGEICNPFIHSKPHSRNGL